MTPRQFNLDFDGQRLQFTQPFATFEARNGAFQWHRLDAAARDFPFHDGAGDALDEIRRALLWSQQHFASGAAVGFTSYDFARQLEPRAFSEHSPSDDLQIPDIRLTFCAHIERSAISTRAAASVVPNGVRQPPAPDYLASVLRIKDYIAAVYEQTSTQRTDVKPLQLTAANKTKCCFDAFFLKFGFTSPPEIRN